MPGNLKKSASSLTSERVICASDTLVIWSSPLSTARISENLMRNLRRSTGTGLSSTAQNAPLLRPACATPPNRTLAVDTEMKDGEKRKPATVTYRGKLRVSGVKRVVKATAS